MRQALNNKVKGNTIIEVLIAMAILAFCSSLAVVIYLNIQKSSLPFFKIKAVELAEQYMNKSVMNSEFTDEGFQAEEFTVKRTINSPQLYPDCYVLRILVFDSNKKKIHELEQIVLKRN